MMINGIVTPSEAAAFGALGVLTLAALYRCLTWDAIKKSVRGALRVTLMAYLIVFGSATFSQLAGLFRRLARLDHLGHRVRP